MKFKYHPGNIEGPLGTHGENVLNFSNNEVWLYISNHKTSEFMAPQIVKCPREQYFIDVVKDYVNQCRKMILSDSPHSDLLFLVR